MSTTYVLGVDVGGTFTDLVAISGEGVVTFTKSPSTLEDQSAGVIAGIEDLARHLGLTAGELLSRTERFVHGTTVATNALLERKGAEVALLTTQGHRDILEMREGLKPDRYNLRMAPIEPLVARHRRLGVVERIDAAGEVRTPLDRASLSQAIEKIKALGVNSVAVCYLHAYRNPRHEIETVEALRKALPELYVSRSSEVLPEIKEYERISTTVVNAYVGPAVQKYLRRLKNRLGEHGFFGNLFVILSHGGMVPIEQAGRLAAATVLSGPAGGIAGALRCAALLDTHDIVPFDMGGTSTDVSLIAGGVTSLTSAGGLAGERIALRSLDIASVGAGGGSIASVDAGGTLHVGPESAGSVPGPACYGRGGTKATVTDANLALGYLDPAKFLGGKRQLDRQATERAIEALAGQLGLSSHQTAAGIYRLINQKMADGVRIVTLRRGVDPRRFALLSFGGAAGLHVAEVARELEIKRVLVPNVASVLSAWGMLQSDLRFELSQTFFNAGGRRADAASLRSLFDDLEARTRDQVKGWFDGPLRFERWGEMRYGEQIFAIDVRLDDMAWDGDNLVQDIENAYHRRHAELYTYSSPEQEVVFANARVAAVGISSAGNELMTVATLRKPAEPSYRDAFFGRWRRTAVYQLPDLAARQHITGPAIVESETTTVVIGENDVARVDDKGWLDIAIG